MKRITTIALLAGAASLLGGAALAQSAAERDSAIAARARAFDGAAVTSLGVTVAQLRDADLLDTSGQELGEVEAVLLGPDGTPSSVLVELEDDVFGDDRLVEIALSTLVAREANRIVRLWDDEIDLVTQQPAEILGQLPDLRPVPPAPS